MNHKDKAKEKVNYYDGKNVSCDNTTEDCLKGHRIGTLVELESTDKVGNPRTNEREKCYKLQWCCPITKRPILGAVVFDDEVGE